MAKGPVKPIKKYWADRRARWESEMLEIVRRTYEMELIRKKPLTPYHVPFVP
jgi:hypothetical protein